MNNKLKAGTLLIIDAGWGIDYEMLGIWTVRVPFSPGDVRATYLSTRPEQNEVYGFWFRDFIEFLTENLYIDRAAVATLHLDYSPEKHELSGDPEFFES